MTAFHAALVALASRHPETAERLARSLNVSLFLTLAIKLIECLSK